MVNYSKKTHAKEGVAQTDKTIATKLTLNMTIKCRNRRWPESTFGKVRSTWIC
ncbi:hypothetical protein O9929_08465 [Vibrio lentus]|nr:hypothetical protein [Vibrio lentus]